MKTFLSFAYESLGFFFEPRKTIDSLGAHYKGILLPMGFTLSLVTLLSFSVARGLAGNWSPSTIFFYISSLYLGQFLFSSIVLAVIGLFAPVAVNIKSFWGLVFATDIILILELPLVLIGTLSPVSLGFLTAALGVWAAVLKLFVIQKMARGNFAKALLLSCAPVFLIILWFITGAVSLVDTLSGMTAGLPF